MDLTPFFLVLVLAAGTAQAAGAPALEQFITTVNSLSADFQQVQKDDKGVVLQASTGKLWLSRPAPGAKATTGMFRWNYEKPYVQLMVCDGKRLWQFDPDLAQAMVRPAAGTLQGTPAQLLTDRAALDQHFKVEAAGTDDGAEHVRLLPKVADTDFKAVELWVKGGVPVRMAFFDPLGGSSEVTFSNVKSNAPLDAKLFKFVPPKGVEVIDTVGPPAP